MSARPIPFTPDLRGRTAVVIGGGASLTKDDCDYARASDAVLIGINDAYRMVDVDILYASDYSWWKNHWEAVKSVQCMKVSQTHGNRPLPDLPLWLVEGQHGVDMGSKRLQFGANSGFAGVHLASLWNAAKIALLGFDMSMKGKRHWFGDHPGDMNKKSNYETWVANFERANCPTPIINCSRETALTCYPRANIQEVL